MAVAVLVVRGSELISREVGETGYELHYLVFGKNGVMGDLEPVKESKAHELCVVVQGVAPTKAMAEEVTMKTTTLNALAKTIRSKNAGTDRITFDIIFQEKANYELVKRSGVLSRTFISELFNIREERICDFVEFDPAYAIKFTIMRSIPSGSAGDSDVFGCQQYPPLLDVDISLE